MEFFTNSDCQTGRLEGEVIASGYAPPLADHGPINALDQTLGGGHVWKGWRWRVLGGDVAAEDVLLGMRKAYRKKWQMEVCFFFNILKHQYKWQKKELHIFAKDLFQILPRHTSFFYLIYPRSSQLSGDPGCPIPPPLSAPTRNRGWGETRDIASFHWKQKTKHQKMTETYTNQL